MFPTKVDNKNNVQNVLPKIDRFCRHLMFYFSYKMWLVILEVSRFVRILPTRSCTVLDMKSVITPSELYKISWNISLVYHVSLCSMGQSARSWSFKVYYLLNEHLLPLDCTRSCMYCTDKILHWLIINVIVTDSKLDKFVCNLPSLMNYEKPCIPWCCLGLYIRASIPIRLSLDGNRTDVCWN